MTGIRTISRIEPGQLALVMGGTYVLFGIIGAVLVYAFASMIPSASSSTFGMMTGFGVILIPVFYGIFGYIGGFIAAVIYNVVCGTVGGIKVTVEE
jgi:hypothetical protein